MSANRVLDAAHFSHPNSTMSTALHVNTSNSTFVPAGMIQLSFNLRNAKDNTPTDNERYRNVLIPELVFPTTVDARFRPILLTKFIELAKSRFDRAMVDSKRMATSVPAEHYTVDGLLNWFVADNKPGHFTKETILEWFNTSATCAYIKSKNSAAASGYSTNYGKLVSPNPGINLQTCTALLAVIQPEDISNPLVQTLVSKLQMVLDKANQSAVKAL